MANNQLIGLFLGAGASYEAGMPLVWELTAELKNWLTPEKMRSLNESWRTQGGGHPDSIIEDFATILLREDFHYENILGYLETQFRRNHTLQQDYHSLYSWLVQMIYYLLYSRQVNNHSHLENRLPYYEGIRALAEKNNPLWIFSLNHDLIVEAIAAKFSIPLYCGFSDQIFTMPRRDLHGNKIGDIRAKILLKKEIENSAMYFPNPPQKGIYLLKIHGALDVFTFNDGEDLLKLIPDENTTRSLLESLRAANEELLYVLPNAPDKRAHALNEIAYADDTGEMQFLRRSLLAGAYKFNKYGSQVLPKILLRHFRTNINFISRLICIGYGFGDDHINQILREWLEFSASRHIDIVNPNSDSIPNFLMHLAPQITVIKSTATDHLDKLGGISRSKKEVLERRVFLRLRSLKKSQVDDYLLEFHRLEHERTINSILEKINSLPMRNGDIDLDLVGDPESIANEWKEEIHGSTEESLDRLLSFLDGKNL